MQVFPNRAYQLLPIWHGNEFRHCMSKCLVVKSTVIISGTLEYYTLITSTTCRRIELFPIFWNLEWTECVLSINCEYCILAALKWLQLAMISNYSRYEHNNDILHNKFEQYGRIYTSRFNTLIKILLKLETLALKCVLVQTLFSNAQNGKGEVGSQLSCSWKYDYCL